MTDIRARFFYRPPLGDFSLDVDLHLPGTGITAIFGESGSGKTTLLRSLAGLNRPENGVLRVNGHTWQDEKRFLKTHQRPLGYVFQEASLFPHLSVQGNLDYARKRAHSASDELEQAIDLLGIGGLLQRMPQNLSGGEKQRVAIARALLIHPQLLLMDEPLAALDYPRKQEILPYLEKLRNLRIPIIYVSHAMEEITRLADHLVIMEAGSARTSAPLQQALAETGTPLTLRRDAGVILEATVNELDPRWHLARIAFDGGELWIANSNLRIGQPVRVRIMARDISLTLQPQSGTSILNLLNGTIEALESADQTTCLARVKVGKSKLLGRLTWRSVHQLQLEPGKSIWLQIKTAALVR